MKDYKDIGLEIGELLILKQKAYGNAFKKTADIMKILYPNGIKFEDIDNVLFLARICDKLCRIATNNGSDLEDPYRDLIGYGLLAVKERFNKED